MKEWTQKAEQILRGRMAQAVERKTIFYLVREPFVFLIHLKMDWQHEAVFPETPSSSYFLYGCAFAGRAEDFRQHIAQWGKDSDSCALRFVRRVASDAQLEAFFAEAFAQFDAWAAAGQEAVRAQSKKLRQAFLQNITALLKPLGFQKRGNHWRLPYRACAVIDFHAQKSSHSDTYYLRFCLSHRDASRACLFCDITPGVTAPVDWQLMDPALVRQAVEKMVRELIQPLLAMDGNALTIPEWLRRRALSCECRSCADCWLESAFFPLIPKA